MIRSQVGYEQGRLMTGLNGNFFCKLLHHMQLPQSFISLIMKCLSTVHYSVVLNGEAQLSFTPERGLRQGDPLSPYLYVLVTEVLSFLIHTSKCNGELAGVSIARAAPHVTHLLFVDVIW